MTQGKRISPTIGNDAVQAIKDMGAEAKWGARFAWKLTGTRLFLNCCAWAG